jgi:hypothetical protein
MSGGRERGPGEEALEGEAPEEAGGDPQEAAPVNRLLTCHFAQQPGLGHMIRLGAVNKVDSPISKSFNFLRCTP